MGASTWLCPAGVTQAWVEMWGSGSDGGPAAFGSGTSGGGGSYSRKYLPVIPGNTYTVEWGPNGSNATFFDLISTAKAINCNSSVTGADGITNNIGDVKFNGGNGVIGGFVDIFTDIPAGGGGSSAGSGGNGNNGTVPSGASVTRGGTGGNGGTSGPTGVNPSIGGNGVSAGPGPGGGGGAAGWGVNNTAIGGIGGIGGLYIWDATAEADFAIVSLDPDLIVGTFGDVPPAPPPLPPSPKSAKRAFMM